MSHTKGPWTAEKKTAVAHVNAYDRGQVFEVSGLTWAALALVATSGREGEANARLIAAAPDLLAALKKLIDGVDDYWLTQNPGAVDAAEAAIAKAEPVAAEGETP